MRNMQISNKLPQFERFPALFITSGEYEAHFYIAFQGKLELKKVLKMPPREEAKEKQGFTGHKAGMQDLSSLSHKGKYIDDLKMRFARNVHAIVHDILANNDMEEIYVFAPKFVMVRILAGLDKNEQKKVRMQFYNEYTKNNPIELIKIFQKEIDKIQKEIIQSPVQRPLIT